MTKRELESFSLIGKYPDYYTEDMICKIEDFDIYLLIMYSDCSTEKDFRKARQKLKQNKLEIFDRLILDIITINTQYTIILNSNQVYEPKTYQYIRDYTNGVKKVIAKKNPPYKVVERNRENFKRYDMKLYNSISRSKQAVYELAKCNDFKYFVTFTINKDKYDRYNLEVYMKAFSKWLNNYARKTEGEKLDYILIPELGKSGAWHIHGLMNGVPSEHLSCFEKGKHPKRLVDSNYLNWEAYEKKFGFCSFGKIRSKEKVSGYITKYIRKSSITQERKLHSRLYYCTQGLKRSTEICRGYNIISIDKYDFENEYAGIKWLYDNE